MAYSKSFRDDTPLPITLNLSDVGFASGANARDVWQAKDMGKIQGSCTVKVPRHGLVLLRLTR